MPGVYRDPVTGKIHPAADLIRDANQRSQAGGAAFGPPSPRDMIVAGTMPGPGVPKIMGPAAPAFDPSGEYGLAPGTFPNIHPDELSMSFTPGEAAGVGTLREDGTMDWQEFDEGTKERHRRRRMNEILAQQLYENPVTASKVKQQFGSLTDVAKMMISLGLAPPVTPSGVAEGMPEVKTEMGARGKATAEAGIREATIKILPELMKEESERTAPARAQQMKLDRLVSALKAKGSLSKDDMNDAVEQLAVAIDPENPAGLIADFEAMAPYGETGKSFFQGKPTHSFIRPEVEPSVSGTQQTPIADMARGLLGQGAGAAPSPVPSVAAPAAGGDPVANAANDPNLSPDEQVNAAKKMAEAIAAEGTAGRAKIERRGEMFARAGEIATGETEQHALTTAMMALADEKAKEAKQRARAEAATRQASLNKRVGKALGRQARPVMAPSFPHIGGLRESSKPGVMKKGTPAWKAVTDAIAAREETAGREISAEEMKALAQKVVAAVQ